MLQAELQAKHLLQVQALEQLQVARLLCSVHIAAGFRNQHVQLVQLS
jgi:hypothetical protein